MTDISREARFLIRKSGYYYRPDSQGYTASAIIAGRYTMEEAEEITHPNGPDGPRDGMSFIADHLVLDEDWQAYRALQARVEELEEKLRYQQSKTTEARAEGEQRGRLQGLDEAATELRQKYEYQAARYVESLKEQSQ